MTADSDFLEFLVKSLVDNPDSVKVERVVDEMGVLLTLDVHPDDMGKIIGRSGNTAKAIRTLLRVVGMKNNARVNLKINEPEGGTGGRRESTSEEAPAMAEGGSPEGEVPSTEGMHSMSGTSDTMGQSATKTVDEAMEDLKI